MTKSAPVVSRVKVQPKRKSASATTLVRKASKAPRRRKEREALDPKTWVTAGIELLAAEGVSSVRVEILAKRLQVTKGSFYWHFKDRQDLLDRMLEEWRRSTLTAVVESVWGNPANARQKLERLWRICLSGRVDNPGGQLEAALRQWSLADEKVAQLIALVDEERIAFLARLYQEIPVLDPQGYARLFYSYVVGRNTVGLRLNLPSSKDDDAARIVLLLTFDH